MDAVPPPLPPSAGSSPDTPVVTYRQAFSPLRALTYGICMGAAASEGWLGLCMAVFLVGTFAFCRVTGPWRGGVTLPGRVVGHHELASSPGLRGEVVEVQTAQGPERVNATSVSQRPASVGTPRQVSMVPGHPLLARVIVPSARAIALGALLIGLVVLLSTQPDGEVGLAVVTASVVGILLGLWGERPPQRAEDMRLRDLTAPRVVTDPLGISPEQASQMAAADVQGIRRLSRWGPWVVSIAAFCTWNACLVLELPPLF